MPWPGKRKPGNAGRRTAETTDELIRQIAQDKAIGRFAPRRPGVETPRAVFMSVVDAVAGHFSGSGWRYARSGPHLSRRDGDISARVEFVSNRLNVAGELVGLWVQIHLGDRTIGKWRKEIGQPLATGDEVARRHLGHLLDPPRWLEWNLVDSTIRPDATADIVETIEGAALPWIESMRRLLDGGLPNPTSLIGHVTELSLIEYLVRAGQLDEAGSVVGEAVERSHERAQGFFAERLGAFRRDGLPGELPAGGSALLAYAVIRFDLPVDSPGAP
ncbi:MAG: hypothetical protein P1T08_07005 [Acidimicrobiia bacterium]|nr:hypothetical protein [Acidimicrobiia bacterium]